MLGVQSRSSSSILLSSDHLKTPQQDPSLSTVSDFPKCIPVDLYFYISIFLHISVHMFIYINFTMVCMTVSWTWVKGEINEHHSFRFAIFSVMLKEK